MPSSERKVGPVIVRQPPPLPKPRRIPEPVRREISEPKPRRILSNKRSLQAVTALAITVGVLLLAVIVSVVVLLKINNKGRPTLCQYLLTHQACFLMFLNPPPPPKKTGFRSNIALLLLYCCLNILQITLESVTEQYLYLKLSVILKLKMAEMTRKVGQVTNLFLRLYSYKQSTVVYMKIYLTVTQSYNYISLPKVSTL